MNRMLHTPEGVRDIYAPECRRMYSVEGAMKTVIETFGYEPIRTPGFEFFDVYSKEVGSIPSKDMYKFFDKENNTLVLRPDFTPSVARAASKTDRIDKKVPMRLYYNGNIYINHKGYQGHLMESRQFGAEYIGDSSVDADAELIAAVVECLKSSGLKDYLVSVTHSDIFSGLIEAANMDPDEADEIRELILNKNFFGLDEILQDKKLPEDIRQLFDILSRMDGDIPEDEEYSAISK
ncbi:MAG: ATP phosphoribosyltransferase regulatory subunit, partial [Lachnospiraceae bacterium]|nr:ATP phosphoribosyltransferase regulatory subunit [Lachnospiraceae bacterium]